MLTKVPPSMQLPKLPSLPRDLFVSRCQLPMRTHQNFSRSLRYHKLKRKEFTVNCRRPARHKNHSSSLCCQHSHQLPPARRQEPASRWATVDVTRTPRTLALRGDEAVPGTARRALFIEKLLSTVKARARRILTPAASSPSRTR